MALRAYFDESGMNQSDPALVISGFVSEADTWDRFSDEWNKAMREWGLERNGWHMSEFEARQGDFSEWPRDRESERRLDYLLDLIIHHAIAIVGAAFPRSLFDAYFVPAPKRTERLYFATAWIALMNTYLLPLDQYRGSKVAVVFGQGARGRHQVQSAYDRLDTSKGERFEFVSLTFAKNSAFPPLQAADILAYEEFRHYPKVYGSEKRRVRYPLKKILDSINPQQRALVDLEGLRRMEAVAKGLR